MGLFDNFGSQFGKGGPGMMPNGGGAGWGGALSIIGAALKDMSTGGQTDNVAHAQNSLMGQQQYFQQMQMRQQLAQAMQQPGITGAPPPAPPVSNQMQAFSPDMAKGYAPPPPNTDALKAMLMQATAAGVDPSPYLDIITKLAPKSDPYTLGPGDIRYGGNNSVLARGAERPTSYSEAPRPGINPATGKKEMFTTGSNGEPKWLGIAAPDNASAPTVRDFIVGDKTVTKQWNPATNAWDEQSSGDRYRPQAAQPEFGRGMEGRSYAILAEGLKDPGKLSTPEYATAWQILSNPRVDPNTGTIVTPDLSAFKPPTSDAGAPGQPPQRRPSVQSFAPPNPSQPEAASAGFANRLDSANKVFNDPDVASAFQSPTNKIAAGVPGVGNYLVGKNFQKADQAQRNFINAQLRRESGAVISDEEFDNARKQYFPQPGDKKEVLAQKKANRDMAVRNMQLSAGNVLLPPGVVQDSSPPRGAPSVPQQQGFGATPGGDIPTVSTPEEAMKLPPGTQFRTPDGRLKVR